MQSPRSVTGTLVASRISLRAPYNHNRLPLPQKDPSEELDFYSMIIFSMNLNMIMLYELYCAWIFSVLQFSRSVVLTLPINYKNYSFCSMWLYWLICIAVFYCMNIFIHNISTLLLLKGIWSFRVFYHLK